MTTALEPEQAAERSSSAGRLFDLRYLIGGLFTVYGVVLTVASFFVGHAKSGDIDINLWLGLAMLALGLFFLAWSWLRPLQADPRPTMVHRDQLDAARAAASQDEPSDFARRVDQALPRRRRSRWFARSRR
jgi:hypothetical protein